MARRTEPIRSFVRPVVDWHRPDDRPVAHDKRHGSPASALHSDRDGRRALIGRIHGAIVAATVGAIVAATIACSVYTRRLSRRWSRQLPRVYTTGDCGGDNRRGDNRRDDRPVYTPYNSGLASSSSGTRTNLVRAERRLVGPDRCFIGGGVAVVVIVVGEVIYRCTAMLSSIYRRRLVVNHRPRFRASDPPLQQHTRSSMKARDCLLYTSPSPRD